VTCGVEKLLRRVIGEDVKLDQRAKPGLNPVLADAGQLEQVLMNLVVNARDAMPGGGTLTLDAKNVTLGAGEQDGVPAGDWVRLTVGDTGCGMDAATQRQIFEPFFTTKPLGQGTGLGLSMVYGFVRQSGGQVRIYSEVGSGTTMCLYLPRHHGASPETVASTATAKTTRERTGKTVLVVDDEPSVRMLVTEVLEEHGYGGIEASDGPSGLRVLESDARIDLLITDVGLPGGLNGRQLADAARTTRPDLKVLFITGYAENAIIGNGQLAPGMRILTKPFVMTTLAERIAEMIGDELKE
jgi:CheY-like chemotaxis protein